MPRRPTAFFFLALVVLISMGGGLWVALPHIAERLIESRLREQGIAPVTVTVSRVDLSGAHLERLSVDGNALVVEGAEVFWRAAALVPEALVVDRLRVNGRWTAEEGLSLGPLDAFLAGDPPQAGEAKGLELPVPRVEVRDAQAKIAPARWFPDRYYERNRHARRSWSRIGLDGRPRSAGIVGAPDVQRHSSGRRGDARCG